VLLAIALPGFLHRENGGLWYVRRSDKKRAAVTEAGYHVHKVWVACEGLERAVGVDPIRIATLL
jgi:hypothetical protein